MTNPDPRGEQALARTTVETPLGPLTLVASAAGLRAARWDDEHPAESIVADPAPGSVLALVAEQLGDYFAGRRREFDVPLDEAGTTFQRLAWAALRTIPFGETISYGQQATRLGRVKAARAVGGANSRNPISVITPCHRVVGASGDLTGFAAGIDRKRWLLDHEARMRSEGAHPVR